MQHLEIPSFPKVTGCDKTLQSICDVDFKRFSSHSKNAAEVNNIDPTRKGKQTLDWRYKMMFESKE